MGIHVILPLFTQQAVFMRTLRITRPDDWHVHFRDEAALQHTVIGSATHFARALVMPNLRPALTTIASLTAYRQRIIKALGHHPLFAPYMTLYLNQNMAPAELEQLKNHPHILGAKFYPAGATTHSQEGAASIKALYPLLDLMQAHDLVLQLHGEVTHGDIFDREALFIEEYLAPLMRDFPKLRVILEHISTQAAVDFVLQAPDTLAATITPHHLFYNRNQLLAGGIKPHYYCLPILKRERDQLAVQQAAVSGNPKFFAGTDSAPHEKENKENACGCAGIYSAPYAVALYAEVFDNLGQLSKLNDFIGRFGADFYHLPITPHDIELINRPQNVPSTLPMGEREVVPIAAGSPLQWSIHEPT